MTNSLNLFIYVDETGNAVNHPYLEENLRSIIPNFDPDNLPQNIEKFVRAVPVVGFYELLANSVPTYQRVDGMLTDIWDVRPMTEDEKAEKIQNIKNSILFLNRYKENFSAWILDETSLTLTPPVPAPEGPYAWRGSTGSWELITEPRPDDGKFYEWNPIYWQWDEVDNKYGLPPEMAAMLTETSIDEVPQDIINNLNLNP